MYLYISTLSLKKECPCFLFLFSLIIPNVFYQMYLQLLPHWSFFCKAKKPQCPQLPLCHVQYHDSDYYISLFPKVVLSPTMDLSALISKPVPMDSYPFPGFGLLLS